MNKKILISVGLGLIVVLILIFSIGKAQLSNNQRKGAHQAESIYNKALAIQSKGQLNEALKLYQTLTKEYPQDPRAADAWYELAKMYEKDNLNQQARAAYTAIVNDFPNFNRIQEVEKGLWDLNIKILFSPVIAETDTVHKVEPQDTLVKIAAKFNTTVDLIMRSNNLKNSLIRPRDRLKISQGKFSVVVDKSQNSLMLKENDKIFKVYTVASGKYNCTPVGAFKIVEKLKNPDWYKSGEGIISAADPKNILGTRWLGLSEPQYGIHGGASKEDLGKQVTNGCIRMENPDVEELFTILPRGTEVTIVD